MIIARYIVAEIVRVFTIAVVVLTMIFVAYRSVMLLNDVVLGELGFRVVSILVLLQALIAWEALLPTALYFSVVMALGRMHRDSEVIALQALGVGEGRTLGAVFTLSLGVALVVACLTVYGRPWAYRVSYALEERAAMELDLERLQAGFFHVLGDGKFVMTFDRVDIPA